MSNLLNWFRAWWKAGPATTQPAKVPSHGVPFTPPSPPPGIDVYKPPEIPYNEVENIFVETFYRAIENEGYGRGDFEVRRMSDRTLSFSLCDGPQLGRIKLRGKTKMQVLTTDDVVWFEDKDLAFYLEHLPFWAAYLRTL